MVSLEIHVSHVVIAKMTISVTKLAVIVLTGVSRAIGDHYVANNALRVGLEIHVSSVVTAKIISVIKPLGTV